jgi:hypothetical protein
MKQSIWMLVNPQHYSVASLLEAGLTTEIDIERIRRKVFEDLR